MSLRHYCLLIPFFLSNLAIAQFVIKAPTSDGQLAIKAPGPYASPYAAATTVGSTLRQVRSDYFSHISGSMKISPTSPNRNFLDDIPPELPIKTSDMIVYGRTRQANAYLSTDQTTIYTEVDLIVDRILKSSRKLNVGEEITIVRRGGAIIYPTGRVLIHQVINRSLPGGGPYTSLLFLKYVPNLQAYSLIGGFEVDAQNVLFDLDRIHVDKDHQRFLNRSPLTRQAVEAKIVEDQ